MMNRLLQFIRNLGWEGVLFGIAGVIATVIGLLDFTSLINLTSDPALRIILSSIGVLLALVVAQNAKRAEQQARHVEVLKAISQIYTAVEQSNSAFGRELQDFHQTLTASVTLKPLMGHQAVYEEVTRLIKACNASEIIRTTSLTSSKFEKETIDPSDEDANKAMTAYQTYFETLAKKIGEQKQKRGLGMVYKCVVGFRPNEMGEPPPNKKRAIHRRRNVFGKYNALDRMELRYIDSSWSLDLIIIGTEHMVIGLPTVAGDTEIRLGMRITDKDLVANVARWYDEYLWRESSEIQWTDEA